MSDKLSKLLVHDGNRGDGLLFVPTRISGDVLYVPEKPISCWEDQVTAEIIRGMSHYSPGSQ